MASDILVVERGVVHDPFADPRMALLEQTIGNMDRLIAVVENLAERVEAIERRELQEVGDGE